MPMCGQSFFIIIIIVLFCQISIFVNILRTKQGVRFCVTNEWLTLSLLELISKYGRFAFMTIMHDEYK
jgi:hypothetical protein